MGVGESAVEVGGQESQGTNAEVTPMYRKQFILYISVCSSTAHRTQHIETIKIL